MAVKKVRQITIAQDSGRFTTLFKRFSGKKEDYDFEGLSALRRLISNERARMLHVIKVKNPESIYKLAKILGRDFKSVRDDVNLLARFGFVDFVHEKKGARQKMRPVIAADSITIEITL